MQRVVPIERSASDAPAAGDTIVLLGSVDRVSSPPLRVRLRRSDDVSPWLALTRIDLRRWALDVPQSFTAPTDVELHPDRPDFLVESVTSSGEEARSAPIAIATRDGEKGRAELQIVRELASVRVNAFDPSTDVSWILFSALAQKEDSPFNTAMAAEEEIRNRDRSDPTRAKRAQFFLALEAAAVEGSTGDDVSVAFALGADAYMARFGSRLRLLSPTAIREAHGALAEALAAFYEGLAPDASSAIKSMDPVIELFEQLTGYRHFEEPPSKWQKLGRWRGRALIADMVRFASGDLLTSGDQRRDLFNCAPNGGYFTLFPTLSLLAHEHYARKCDSRADLWRWWIRATMAGLEAFTDVFDARVGKRNAGRFGWESDCPLVRARAWPRARIARTVERYAKLTPEQARDRFTRTLRYAFCETDGDELAGDVGPRN